MIELARLEVPDTCQTKLSRQIAQSIQTYFVNTPGEFVKELRVFFKAGEWYLWRVLVLGQLKIH